MKSHRPLHTLIVMACALSLGCSVARTGEVSPDARDATSTSDTSLDGGADSLIDDTDGPTCRVRADCADLGPDWECVAEYPSIPCGAPPHAGECEGDGDCPRDTICTQHPENCGGPLTTCTPRCTPASCEAGTTCASSGRCVADRCTDGFVCPPHTQCAEDQANSDAHGCAPVPCDDDDGCAQGTSCVVGTCRPQLGRCIDPTEWTAPPGVGQ